MISAIFGVDPGANGGIAGLTVTGGFIGSMRMPDWDGLCAFLVKAPEGSLFVLERAQAMPGQGVTSMFNYGQHYGRLLGTISTAGFHYMEVRPQIWTRYIHALGNFQETWKGEPKRKSLAMAQKLFPEVNLVPERCRKPHEGIIDALLIAEWARRTQIQEE